MSLITYDIDYSIVICTYNPDERLLKRCLAAIFALDTEGITTEVILVDNNSLQPVERLPYVRDYIRRLPTMKTLMVAVQGVNYARIAAIAESRGKYVIYFDYDNEPAPNYLQELKLLHAKYPQVAALGPGEITVDFIDGIDSGIEEYAREAFQERHEDAMKFSSVREWKSCYPSGTGLCTYTFLLKEYIALMRQGRFAMPAREGKELTSGEDTQLVLYCISKGYFAGVSPTLQLKHIIHKERANAEYLQRLAYRTGFCYETCLVQLFPKHKNKLKHELLSESKFSSRTLKKFIKTRMHSDPHKVLELVQFIAMHAGVYIAMHKPVPPVVKRIIKYLKLD